MPNRIAQSTLNASTIDILNVIRQNATYDYQQNVPVVETAVDIPKVGEIIYGTPAFANQFINALVNRIAIVRMQSATFNNPYTSLKKGYLEFGETVENIFVQIAKVVEFDADKAKAREFKRTYPDVRSAFHTMNWRVMYPVTIQDEDLKRAFLSMDGVQNLIAKIVDSVYTAAEYDEFLLFKYLLIKAVAKGQMYPVSMDMTDIKNSAVNFRGYSNILPFMKSDYNEAAVLTTTPKDKQAIFMDAFFNAQYDVEVLASAFNMDKAEFMGKLHLIDDFTTFDNTRFEVIREHSDGLEEVTADELALMKGVKAILVDENWFQVYDNNNKFTEKYVASGLYWNYFYHTWKTISHSPFANAIVFVDSSTISVVETEPTIKLVSRDIDGQGNCVVNFAIEDQSISDKGSWEFVQTEECTSLGIGVQKYGSYLIPANVSSEIYITLRNTYTNTKATVPTAYNLKTAPDVGTEISTELG